MVDERATEFGQLVTADHVYAHSEALEGIEHALDLLVIYDCGTGILAAYPAASKGMKETVESLIRCTGSERKIKRLRGRILRLQKLQPIRVAVGRERASAQV